MFFVLQTIKALGTSIDKLKTTITDSVKKMPAAAAANTAKTERVAPKPGVAGSVSLVRATKLVRTRTTSAGADAKPTDPVPTVAPVKPNDAAAKESVGFLQFYWTV